MVPPLPSDTSHLLCIDLLIPMIWVKSPDLFCSASKTLADNVNAYVLDPTSPFAIFPQTDKAYHTSAAQRRPPTGCSTLTSTWAI